MSRLATTPSTVGAVDWDVQPDLLLLPEVCLITRHATKTAYAQLAGGRFPIAHLPDVRPYRFRTVDVKAWVTKGEVTNKALAVKLRRRSARKARRAAAHDPVVSHAAPAPSL